MTPTALQPATRVVARSRRRVVFTGGPGAGKTTAIDLLRRELGERLVVVPEAGTLLFRGGFPRDAHVPEAQRAAQRAIYYVQRNLEDAQAALYPERILLCDRGTVDGAAYWPEDGDFFRAVGSSYETELARYDAVVFFETAAAGGISIEGGNPIRNESLAQAVALDRRLAQLWSRHPRFTFIAHEQSFFEKLAHGLAAMKACVAELDREASRCSASA
ncbi:MAG: ATP-binding protein [Myxococcales bacterium]|nr:ATP-binding protein [Myxococcales bacterium]MCB9732747.1 ATP-binding protein [Deltaproteobacteria bacterium]